MRVERGKKTPSAHAVPVTAVVLVVDRKGISSPFHTF